MALVFRSLPPSSLHHKAITTTLSAWIFLNTNYDGFRSVETIALARRHPRARPTDMPDIALAAASAAHRQLMIPPLEALFMFQRQRHGALSWLASISPSAATRAVAEIVGVVSNAVTVGSTGGRAASHAPGDRRVHKRRSLETTCQPNDDNLEKPDAAAPRNGVVTSILSESSTSALASDSEWIGLADLHALPGSDAGGRFTPAAESRQRAGGMSRRESTGHCEPRGDSIPKISDGTTATATAISTHPTTSVIDAGSSGGLSYEEWLWKCTTVDTELNLQIGEFTLRQNQVC